MLPLTLALSYVRVGHGLVLKKQNFRRNRFFKACHTGRMR